jgi:hypothetical protein
MEEIKKMLLDFMVTEENLFVHYSEIPSQFTDDLAMIDEMAADFVEDEED